jgi:hypothetical protein
LVFSGIGLAWGAGAPCISNRKIAVGLFISKTIERMGGDPVPFYGWLVNPAP